MLFKALNVESDPYRFYHYDPSTVQTPVVSNSLIQLNKPVNTLRFTFNIGSMIEGECYVKFNGMSTYYPLYNKKNEIVNGLLPGIYLAVFYEGYVILVNDEPLTPNNILNFDILGETLNYINNKVDELNLNSNLVVSVNGMLPDENGNVELEIESVDLTNYATKSELGNYVKDEDLLEFLTADELIEYAKLTDLQLYATESRVSQLASNISRRIYDIENYNFMNMGRITNHATTTHVGHVKIDGETIVISEDGTISAVQQIIPDATEVVDNLNSMESNKALSAKQGNLLHSNLDILEYNLNTHELNVATDSLLGHVKVDNETILVDEYGTISAVQQIIPEQLEIVDHLNSMESNKVLSANQGKELKFNIDTVESALYDHELYIANENTLGHVKVDNETITVSNDGTISAVQQVIPEQVEVFDSLSSDSTINPLSAKQGKVLDNKIDNKVNVNGNLSNIKVFTTTTTVNGSDGRWSVDYSNMEFTEVLHVSTTVLAGSFSQANTPLSTNVGNVELTYCDGKAFKVTSAGLLTAMQQVPVESGTKVMVMVTGI